MKEKANNVCFWRSLPRTTALWLLMSLCYASSVTAAIDVITVPGSQTVDWTNLVQTTATAAQTYDMLQRMIRDMQPWGGLAIEGLQGDMNRILGLLAQLQGLIPFDAAAAAAVFDVLYPADIEATLCHPEALAAWRLEAVRQTRLAHRDSVQAEGLIGQIGEMLGRVLGVVQQIMATGGKVEGLQTIGQNGSLALTEQARLATIMAVVSRATASREAYAVTERRAQECIHAAALESSPRQVPFPLGGGLQ